MDEWGIAGKTSLVTGAASGIGRATVLKLVGAGCRTVALDRDEAGLATLVAEAGAAACMPVVVDLAEPGATRTAVREAVERLDGIAIVVNNAGIGFRADALEDHPRSMGPDVRGKRPGTADRVPGHAAPRMLERGAGVIVNVASVAGLIGIPLRAAYGASKAALISLTRSLAVDYASRGIRANCVAPGTIETPWVDRIIAGADQPAALRQQMAERQIVGRLGTAEEIADTILFLASARASFFHGSAVVVDGGYGAR